MGDDFGLDDLVDLAKEGGGLYRAYTGDEPGQVPAPPRQQGPAAPQQPAAAAAGMGFNGILVPILAALVLGWIGWKVSGKPLVGFLAAAVAFAVAWFFFKS